MNSENNDGDEVSEVELFHAWEWICDECGTSNFASSVTLPIEEAQEIGLDVIMPPDDDGEKREGQELVVYSEPEYVVCADCGTEYKTVNKGKEE